MNKQLPHEQNEECLDSGLLLRLRDGELNTNEQAQALTHIARCADCSADARNIHVGGEEVYQLLSSLDAPAHVMPASATALNAIHARIHKEERQEDIYLVPLDGQASPYAVPLKKRQRRYPWAIAAVAAALIAVLVLPNAGAIATAFLALFQVQQFHPVTLDASRAGQQVFSAVSKFADVTITPGKDVQLSNVTRQVAQQHVSFPLLLPTHLPAGVSTTVQYDVFGGANGVFTFDAAKARAYMQQIGDGNIQIPPQLVGAIYAIKVAPGVLITYGNQCQKDSTSSCNTQKRLLVGEIPSPVVQGDNASSLTTLRDFMLSLKHLPPDVHNLWQNTDLSTGTIPVPMPTTQTSAQSVTVAGSSGILLTDDSLKYGGVLWQAKGIVYAIVTNTSDKQAIMDTANSLQ